MQQPTEKTFRRGGEAGVEPVWKDAVPSFEMTIGKTKKMRIHQVMVLDGHHRLLSTQQPTKSRRDRGGAWGTCDTIVLGEVEVKEDKN